MEGDSYEAKRHNFDSISGADYELTEPAKKVLEKFMEDPDADKEEHTYTVEFQPGSIGIDGDWPIGRVKDVPAGGQAHRLGVQIGSTVLKVNDVNYTEEVLDAAIGGTTPYTVMFQGSSFQRKQEHTYAVEFQPGSIGIDGEWSTGRVKDVPAGGQAHRLGVQIGSTILKVSDVSYTEEVLDAAIGGKAPYTVMFQGSRFQRKQATDKLGCVLYTFGKDYRQAVNAIVEMGLVEPPASNYFFIARNAINREIFAFPMHQTHMSGYVDWTSKNPAIREEGANGCLQKLSHLAEWQTTSVVPNACDCYDAYRFKDDSAFRVFVDGLLQRGHVVFRACYDSQHESFRSRVVGEENKKGLCKVLSSSSHIIAFDDNPDDWELVDKHGLRVVYPEKSQAATIVRVVSPAKACANDEETNMVAELESFLKAINESLVDQRSKL